TISTFVSSNCVTLANNASTTVASGGTWEYGTDNSTAINSAMNAANAAGGGTVYIPPGCFMICTGLNVPLCGQLRGAKGRGLSTGNTTPQAWCSPQGGGSWLVPVDLVNPATLFSNSGSGHGTGLDGINFFYQQLQSPGVGWTPVVYPYATSIQD